MVYGACLESKYASAYAGPNPASSAIQYARLVWAYFIAQVGFGQAETSS
ncbi:MAG: hypothetical protein UW41_C0021G0002 [Candidatus Collierbacteria bacterium GW2011_GWC2_44_18]|uniref:Uncharacterized protein n=1 Tax=Candidatus Collierbacteria bacterium GW2011_GWC2_44_18 TaxID=1618392 RepID=A0A0G1HNB7_9BACT|nr:MAG: hypothetical protein UW16_C0033G0002 [Microgenomates group bacterium GW2011_GWC1_44_10]KKT48676.1 MAG: hypothetical protein UW41_C0021G0002 [Candidatus Collierbacteria bacterium GW2011_GWC2_44_18]